MTELLTLATTFLPIASHDDWGPGPWILFVPLVWIAIIFTVAWLVRGRGWRRSWGPPRGGPTALEILDRRFAEGEISAQEYRDRRTFLEDHGSGTVGR
jgi:putative membrane protein